MSEGGTKKQCPMCKKITTCKAVNPTQLGKKSGQRWYKADHSDINWFRRGLICQTCNHKWLSAEIPEVFLTELVELRNALGDIKNHAESYMSESQKAADSLLELNKSLSVLKALDVYKKTD